MPRLTDAQLAIRRSGLTATDVVVLAGLSPYSGASAMAIYAEKMGAKSARSESEAMSLGHELEPIILRALASKRDLTIRDGDTTRSKFWSHHLATPDGIHMPHARAEAVCEAKAVGLHYADAWGEDDGDVPDHVIAQVHWQMHCAELPRAFVGALIGTEVRTYQVVRDDDLIAALVEVADRFWTDHVVAHQPPAPDGSYAASSAIASIFPRHRGQLVEATPALDTLALQVLELRLQEADVERRRKTLEQEMQLIIGDADGVEGSSWRCSWKHQEAAEVKAHTRAASRPFRITEKKARRNAA